MKTFHLAVIVPAIVMMAGAQAFAGSATFSGNGNSEFGGALGNGSLMVSDDGSGGIKFQFTLGSGFQGSSLGNGSGTVANDNNQNDIVVYIDNGTGGGIGASTAGVQDDADGGRRAVSQYGDASDQSILNFGGMMSPEYALDIESIEGEVYTLSNASSRGAGFGMSIVDVAPTGQTGLFGSALAYSISGNVETLDVPAADIGLTPYSGSTLKMVAMEVSESGYSSDEATVELTGTEGWGGTATISNVDRFTAQAAVPEPGTWALMGAGMALLSGWKIKYKR